MPELVFKIPAETVRQAIAEAVQRFELDEAVIREDERAKVAEQIAAAIAERWGAVDTDATFHRKHALEEAAEIAREHARRTA